MHWFTHVESRIETLREHRVMVRTLTKKITNIILKWQNTTYHIVQFLLIVIHLLYDRLGWKKVKYRFGRRRDCSRENFRPNWLIRQRFLKWELFNKKKYIKCTFWSPPSRNSTLSISISHLSDLSLLSLPSDSLLSLNQQFDRSLPLASPPSSIVWVHDKISNERTSEREGPSERARRESEERQELSPSTVLCFLRNLLLTVQLWTVLKQDVEQWYRMFRSFYFPSTSISRPFHHFSHILIFVSSLVLTITFFPFRSF